MSTVAGTKTGGRPLADTLIVADPIETARTTPPGSTPITAGAELLNESPEVTGATLPSL